MSFCGQADGKFIMVWLDVRVSFGSNKSGGWLETLRFLMHWQSPQSENSFPLPQCRSHHLADLELFLFTRTIIIFWLVGLIFFFLKDRKQFVLGSLESLTT